MAETILKETRIPYNTALEHPPQSGEVTFLEKNGQPVAAVVSMAEFTAFQRWREEEANRQHRQSEAATIEREHLAFQAMLPTLLLQYPGRVVAIHQGEVIAVGDERMDVWQQARQQVNGAPVYVQKVEFPPQIHKMPSRKVIRDVAV